MKTQTQPANAYAAPSASRHATSARAKRAARRALIAGHRRRDYLAPIAASLTWGSAIYTEHWLTATGATELLAYGSASALAGTATVAAAKLGVRHHGALYGGTIATGALGWSAWQVTAPSLPGVAIGAIGTVLASVPYWQWLARHRLDRAKLAGKKGAPIDDPGNVLLAPDDVCGALAVLGVAGAYLDRMDRRPDGGWVAVVALPVGTAPQTVMAPAMRGKLAAALRLPPGWQMDIVDGGASHHVIVSAGPGVAPRPDISTPDRHPMLDHLAEWDPWERVPIGTDLDTGETVHATLMGNAGILIAGMPRMGKSVLLNAVLAHLVLTRAKLILVDPKYVELSPWAPFADKFVGRDPEAFLAMLLELQEEVDRRYAKLVAEGRTKAVPGDGWEPIALLIDELAALIDIPDAKTRKQIISVLRDILSRGPACGMPVILATQKPEDRVIPSMIRDMCGQRVAFATTTPQMTDTILGQGFASKGAKAHDLDEEADKGIAYMKADGKSFRRLRTYPFEPPERQQVMAFAHGLWPDRRGAEVPLPGTDEGGPELDPTPPGGGRRLRSVPCFPDGTRIPENRVGLWQAMDRAGAGGFTINDLVALGMPGYSARTSVDGPLQQWRRAGWVVEIGKHHRAQLFALVHHTKAA